MKETIFLATASGSSMVHRAYMAGVMILTHNFVCTDGPVVPHTAQGLYVENNRNILTGEFIKSGASHLLFIDTDIGGFGVQHVRALLDADKDVVSGCYAFKDGSGRIVGAMTGEREGDLVKCSVVPGGFLLIKRSAVLHVMAAFPDYVYNEPGLGIVPAIWTAKYTPGEPCYRDDAAFSKHCRDAGLRLWMHKKVKLVHFGEQGFGIV